MSFLFFLNLKKYKFSFFFCHLLLSLSNVCGIHWHKSLMFTQFFCGVLFHYMNILQFIFSILLLMYIWIVSSFRQCFYRQLGSDTLRQELYIYITPVYNLELLGHNKFMFSTFLSTANVFFQNICTDIYLHQQCMKSDIVSMSSATVGIVKFTISSNMVQVY